MLRRALATALSLRPAFGTPALSSTFARRLGSAHHDAHHDAAPVEEPEAVQPATAQLFDKSHPEYEQAMKSWNDLSNVPPEIQDMFKANVPIPVPFNLARYVDNIKRCNALKKNGINEDGFEEAWTKYNLSTGSFTLEWALPSPPPIHTFEELPIIKEAPDFQA